MHVAVPLALAGPGFRHDLAAQDVAEEREGVVELFVVDARVQVLHEDVPHVAAAEAGVALGPHDAAGAGLDHGVVHRVQGAFGVGQVVEIDVAVAQGSACDGVAAHADAGHRSHGVEDLEEQAFVDVRGQVSDVEGCGLGVSKGVGSPRGRVRSCRGIGWHGHVIYCLLVCLFVICLFVWLVMKK